MSEVSEAKEEAKPEPKEAPSPPIAERVKAWARANPDPLTLVYHGRSPQQLRGLAEQYLQNVAAAAESRSVE